MGVEDFAEAVFDGWGLISPLGEQDYVAVVLCEGVGDGYAVYFSAAVNV